jgi:hypothetical protein
MTMYGFEKKTILQISGCSPQCYDVGSLFCLANVGLNLFAAHLSYNAARSYDCPNARRSSVVRGQKTAVR